MAYSGRIVRAGFTLIELSIVLVIIGLIIGGVLVGKDLIRASELRGHLAQMERFNTAANAFRLKYNCIPGDCSTATSFGLTGNGNNNGFVSGLVDTVSNAAAFQLDTKTSTINSIPFFFLNGATSQEPKFFLSHLKDSGLLSEKLITVVTDGDPYTLEMPESFGTTAIALVAWNGRHYFKSGIEKFDVGWANAGLPKYRNNYSPADAAYIHTKIGAGSITLGNNGPSDTFTPLALLAREKIITTNAPPGAERFYWNLTSSGAGGASSNVCMNTSVTPAYFNVANQRPLCGLIIQAGF